MEDEPEDVMEPFAPMLREPPIVRFALEMVRFESETFTLPLML